MPFCFVSPHHSFSVRERMNTETGLCLATGRSDFTYSFLTMFYSQTCIPYAHLPNLIGQSALNQMLYAWSFACHALANNLCRERCWEASLCYTIQFQIVPNISRITSPICLQKNSWRPGLCSHIWFYGYLGMGGWWWVQIQALILGSFPLGLTQGLLELVEIFSPMCMNSGLGLSISTEAWLILERPKSHPSTPSFLTACCTDLMHQKAVHRNLLALMTAKSVSLSKFPAVTWRWSRWFKQNLPALISLVHLYSESCELNC